jgi:hypothetical protein
MTLPDGGTLAVVSNGFWWSSEARIVKLVPSGGIPNTFDFQAVDNAKNPPPRPDTGGDGSSDGGGNSDGGGDSASGDGGNDTTTGDGSGDLTDGLNLYEGSDPFAGEDKNYFDDPTGATLYNPDGTEVI